MDAQEIQAFLRQHWELFQMGIGVLCLIGAVRDWDWLCGGRRHPPGREPLWKNWSAVFLWSLRNGAAPRRPLDGRILKRRGSNKTPRLL